MKKAINVFMSVMFMCLFSACGDDVTFEAPVLEPDSKEEMMAEFASILSKTVYENPAVRMLLKQCGEAGDGNIAYGSVKDMYVDGVPFRDRLVENSSEMRMKKIEMMLPELGILFPDIRLFDVCAGNYDSRDAELPVAVKTGKGDIVYVGGRFADLLSGEDIPGFHVLVVTEGNGKDGMNGGKHKAEDIGSDMNLTGNEAMRKAYECAGKDGTDGDVVLQRDYLYYGITADHPSGQFNTLRNEYVSYVDIDPKMYGFMSDEDGETLDMLWTGGRYVFKMNVMKAGCDEALVVKTALRPDEIWDISLDGASVRPTAFNGTKKIYRIDTDRLAAKRHYFAPDELPLGGWNLAEEAVSRHIVVEEEDFGHGKRQTMEFNWRRMDGNCFDGDTKLMAGIGNYVKDGLGTNGTTVTTNKTHTEWGAVCIVGTDRSDVLGSTTVHYDDPIVRTLGTDGSCRLQEYGMGGIKFAIAVK